jgi:hypothetical protein
MVSNVFNGLALTSSKGQRDREADPAGGGSQNADLQSCRYGTTPALRATTPH